MTTGIVLTQSGDGVREFGRALIAARQDLHIATLHDVSINMRMLLEHAREVFARECIVALNAFDHIGKEAALRQRINSRPPAIPRKARRKMARKWAR